MNTKQEVNPTPAEPVEEIVELNVDEQAHVAGGALDTFLKLGSIKGE